MLRPQHRVKRLAIGISGASGAIYGVRLLEVLKETPIETHLVMSKAAHLTVHQELKMKPAKVEALADLAYPDQDIGAAISSGSFPIDGMIVAPCSMRSLAEIANGTTSTLLTRAADVMLKEQRPLVLMVRESPLHGIHLQNMKVLADMGVVIAPPVPAFYNAPETIDDLVNHSVGRVLDSLGIENDVVKRWNGMRR